MASSRVTQGMINTQFMRNLNTNLNRMDNLQNQLATGRRINKPSDDPVGISFAMRYRSELAANEQYQENVGAATSWLEYTDSTLGKANEIIQRVRELAVKGATGTNPEAAMDSIKSELEQLYGEMINIGNSDFNGKHVFNGQKTNLAPYTSEKAATTSTDNSDINFEIGAGVKLSVNVSGDRVFGSPEEDDNLFQVMNTLISGLEKNDNKAVNDALGKLDSRIDKFLGVRAEVGAKMNRVELAQDRLDNISSNLEMLQTKVEDVDVAVAITNLKTSQNVYQASLSVGAQIIRPSLVDFLR